MIKSACVIFALVEALEGVQHAQVVNILKGGDPMSSAFTVNGTLVRIAGLKGQPL
jgi:hypothetical protein